MNFPTTECINICFFHNNIENDSDDLGDLSNGGNFDD